MAKEVVEEETKWRRPDVGRHMQGRFFTIFLVQGEGWKYQGGKQKTMTYKFSRIVIFIWYEIYNYEIKSFTNVFSSKCFRKNQCIWLCIWVGPFHWSNFQKSLYKSLHHLLIGIQILLYHMLHNSIKFWNKTKSRLEN